ncbi:unnamed protein product [Adineta steineri]|uniref:Helitron helicase-like domain-containing protein n=1 Tax=Adineta steineri TaxID=433720 RepID=A0A815IX58_9BILA|nr:unnamed protein product [Adineta steineri]CAF4098373.1 unnamed protein product [Adineta steineri]
MHNVLLSNINDALLKPHQNLYETIPDIRPANAQDTDFDEEMIFSNEQGCHETTTHKNSTYLISNGRILYRDGLLQGESSSGADCRMCHECWLAVSKGKISKFSPANGMWIGDVPDQLKGLTIPEQKLISLYRHNSCIIKLHSPWHSPSTAQPALKGNCITFPQNLSNIATSLPLSPNELSASIKIIFIGSSKPARHHLRKILSVRRQRILDALIWLKENNVLYSHISLDKHIIASLPDDDVPESIWETLDHILDDKNALAEREGYTEDPLTSDQAMSEKATSDFIPLNPSGVLDVNGASVSVEDINNQMLQKLRIDTNKQSANLSEINTDDDLIYMVPRGSAPTNEYNNPTLLLGLYPTLFPYGTGAFEDTSRPAKISFKKQIHKTADQIASLNADDIKQVLNGIEKNKINTSSRSPQVNALLSQVKAVGGKVMGSAQSRSMLRNQIHGLIFNQGLPSIFLTINPADINSRVALYFAGIDLDLDAIIPNNLPSTYQRAEIIASHPVSTAKFFHRLVTTIIETMILGEGVLGPVKAYYGTVENQGRGSLHLHMLIWLDHKYTPSQLRKNIKDEQFRNNLRDYLEDIISEDLDHL